MVDGPTRNIKWRCNRPRHRFVATNVMQKNSEQRKTMSTQTQTPRSNEAKGTQTPASIAWFEIPADNIERARKFYGSLFGWKIEQFQNMPDYWHIDTGGSDDTPDGGLMKRMEAKQP